MCVIVSIKMRSNRWFTVQLAVLSVCCGALAQNNFRSPIERTQDFQPQFSGVQFQPTNNIGSSPQQIQPQFQQNRIQPGQFSDVKAIELQQQQFRDNVAQSLRERARTAQLETTTQNIQNIQSNLIPQAPIQQFPTQEFQLPQQRRPLPNIQRRPVTVKLSQPRLVPQTQAQQPQFRQPAIQQPQFSQQTSQPQFQQQNAGIDQQRIAPEVQNNFQAQQRPVPIQAIQPQFSKEVTSRRPDFSKDNEDLQRKQNENAHYSFGTSLVDGIMDSQQARSETRNGLQTEGMYSYSDGFYKRTVYYEADSNGYRIVKEETMPIGNGPQFDLNGQVDVETNVGGVESHYSITAADVPFLHKQQ